MTYVLHVRPIVTGETAEVYAYYEAIEPGLGERFLLALRDVT